MNILYFLIYISMLSTLFNLHCKKNPANPVRNNPLDSNNIITSGDPFNLSAVIADGGVKLSWSKVNVESVQGYNIYRSEQETTDYSRIEQVSKDTTYTDTTVEYGHIYWYKVTANIASGNESNLTNVAAVSINTVYIDMIYIPAGEFTMGSNSGNPTEQPVHNVYLNAYYIDQYEVTNQKYAAYLNEALANGDIQASSSNVRKDDNVLLVLDASFCHISYSGVTFTVDSGKENHPIIAVTWYGAIAYAKFYGKRLPTEAEWEKAARSIDQRTYPWGEAILTPSHCNYNLNVGDTTPVGSYSPTGDSPYGCCDMAGNVWEWCNDWYDSSYYNYSPMQNPKGPVSGIYRTLRGGSWSYAGAFVRCSYRDYYGPDRYLSSIGFRCAH